MPPLSTISLRHSGTPRLSQGPYFDFSKQTSISSEESHHLIRFLTFVRKRIGEAAVLPVELSGRHRRRRRRSRLRDLRRSESTCHSPLSNYHGVQGSAKCWAPGCVTLGESIGVSSHAVMQLMKSECNTQIWDSTIFRAMYIISRIHSIPHRAMHSTIMMYTVLLVPYKTYKTFGQRLRGSW